MKASLKILLRNNYVTKDGKRQVCLRYTAYRQCTFIGLNISVLPQHWSEKKSAVLSGDHHYLFYNKLTSKQEDLRTYITVSYTDGASKTRVRNIARQFAHAYPSGGEMIRVYVNIERKMSDTTQRGLLNEMRSVWKIKGNLSLEEHFEPVGSTVGNYLQRIFDMRDFN